MNSLFLWAALLCSADPLEDGTLIFLENASSVVQAATRGTVGHVAICMTDEGQPWIYEATPARVRRVTPADYYEELVRINVGRGERKKIRLLAIRPQAPYSEGEKKEMRSYLNAQLGRR